MPRSALLRIRDMVQAGRRVLELTSELDLAGFRSAQETVEAVSFNIMVPGEAATALPDDVRAAAVEIPWRLIRAMRNRLAHEYYAIDPLIVWMTATEDLPAVVAALERLETSLAKAEGK